MILRLFLRLVYSLALRAGMIRSLKAFFPLWAASDAIYIGPAGPSATTYPELIALRKIVASTSISDAEILRHFSHPSPWVVGYCFEVLVERRSALLKNLPASLFSRAEPVCEGFACFRFHQPLSEYIRDRLQAKGLGAAHVSGR
ncbi:hypothetical protein CfE428DRAFT_5220 [Chthoniobacter flavus Ellin428]|uniref:Uncharacterized protein n=2 Tax=Chthoniobacter flavus TaxID=191863 RepID=B4D8I0_9BACT|nr:hypothetical protein CfE428DRAFT_5220 [Chthoniobacter flavus Ellin428]TCO86973.1 hypothetical protein EV701_12568 [Chthoniobacter flavus]